MRFLGTIVIGFIMETVFSNYLVVAAGLVAGGVPMAAVI